VEFKNVKLTKQREEWWLPEGAFDERNEEPLV
jgi:hypothetical protein